MRAQVRQCHLHSISVHCKGPVEPKQASMPFTTASKCVPETSRCYKSHRGQNDKRTPCLYRQQAEHGVELRMTQPSKSRTGNLLGPDFSNEGRVHGIPQGTPLAGPCQARGGVHHRGCPCHPRVQKSGHLHKILKHEVLSSSISQACPGTQSGFSFTPAVSGGT